MNGMELIEAIRAERADPPSGIVTLGLAGTHHWLTDLGPGHAVFEWPVDDAHANLEGAVICSWTMALGDQVLFFASNTLCGDGESTRMIRCALDCLEPITGGILRIDGRVEERTGDQLTCRCEYHLEDGTLAAVLTAIIDIRR